MIGRRQFITLLGGAAAAWPLGVAAQQADRIRRIGVLMAIAEGDAEWQRRISAFRQGLEKLGWIVGHNLEIEFRWGTGDAEVTRRAATDLLTRAPEVIVANGQALRALWQATRAVPIVFTEVSEPVTQGYVTNLAQPGGNVTGFTNLEPTVGAKWLQLLKEIAPQVTRIAVIANPEGAAAALLARSAEEAAPTFGVVATTASVHDLAEIENVMVAMDRKEGGGLIFPIGSFFSAHRQQIIGLAARYRLPAIYPHRFFADEGGLVSYGNNSLDQYRKAAEYVDRILRGEQPGNLPVQQPTKFELVINLKTAKALGLSVPQTLLLAADEVIE
jgi:putative ABC transport system substrate-binding protein